MKIGLLTQYYKPEMGAPQNRLYEMVRGLKELGNEVYIVTSMPNYPTGKIFPEYQGKIVSHEIMDDIPIRSIRVSATCMQLLTCIFLNNVYCFLNGLIHVRNNNFFMHVPRSIPCKENQLVMSRLLNDKIRIT